MLRRSFELVTYQKLENENYIEIVSEILNFNHRKSLNLLKDIIMYLLYVIDRHYNPENKLTINDIIDIAKEEELLSKHYKIFHLLLKGRKRVYKNRYSYYAPGKHIGLFFN